MHKFRWDDLQILMAVATHGSASAAASALGVNHSTILRRVAAFEDEQGVKLFERRSSGYTPTPAGLALLRATQQMADHALEIERRILGLDRELAGDIVLTTTDSVFLTVLAPHIASFRDTHPDITVNATITNQRLDLGRLDADIGVRPSRQPPEDLLGRRTGALAFAVYGQRGKNSGATFDISGDAFDMMGPHDWLGGANALLNAPVSQWMGQTLPEARIVARADSFVALKAMAEAGLGIAILPCCLGDSCAGLVRLLGPIPELETSLWILTHRDLRNTARVRALSNHIAKGLKKDRAKLEGTISGR